MFIKRLQWKEFNVDMATVEAKLRAEHPTFLSSQAYSHLELYFSAVVSDEMDAAIDQYWSELEEDSDEASSYRPAAAIIDALKNLKVSAATKTWDNMTALERKAAMNLDITKAELIAAELV